MRVHIFDYSDFSYDRTQTDDDISMGDVIVIPTENIAAVLYQAWPIAVTPNYGEFHTLSVSVDEFILQEKSESDYDKYRKAFDLALTVADAMA